MEIPIMSYRNLNGVIQLANSQNGTAIDLTSDGGNSNHNFIKVGQTFQTDNDIAQQRLNSALTLQERLTRDLGITVTLNAGVATEGSSVDERGVKFSNIAIQYDEQQLVETKLLAGITDGYAFLGANYGETDEIGIKLENIELGLVLYQTTDFAIPTNTTAMTYALTGMGDASIVGIPDFTLNGSLQLKVNNTGSAVNETITTPTGEVILEFAETEGFLTQIQGNATLNIANVVDISGDFFFEKNKIDPDTTQFLIGVAGFEAFFGNNYGQPDAIGVQISEGNLGLIIEKQGASDAIFALSSSGEAEFIGIEGLTIEGSLGLAVNRMGKAVDQTINVNGNDININFSDTETNITRLQGNATVEILGVAAVTGDFYFEKNTIDTTTQLLVGVDNFEAFFGYGYDTADAMGIELTQGQLGLIIEKEGTSDSTYALKGSGKAEVIGIDDLTIQGSLSFAVNRMGKAVAETIEFGEDSSIDITFNETETNITRLQGNAILDLAGFAYIDGEFFFEKDTNNNQILVAGNSIDAFVGSEYGTIEAVGVELTDGELGLIIQNGKYAVKASGNTALIGIEELTLDGRLELQINRLGTSIDQTLTLPSGETIAVKFDDGVDLTRLQGNINLDVAGFAAVNGEFFVEKTYDVNTELTQLIIGANEVEAFVGSGYQTDNATGFLLSDGKLGLVVNRTGLETAKYALTASGNAGLVGVKELTLEGTLNLEINRMGEVFNQNITLPSGETLTLDFTSADDLTRLQGNATFNAAGLALIDGEFFVEKTVNNDLTKLLVGAGNVTAFVGSGYDTASEMGVKVTDASLGLVIEKIGNNEALYALQAGGNAQIVGIDQLSLTGNLDVAINRLGKAVDQSIFLPSGTELKVNFSDTETNITRLQGDVSLDIAGSAVVSGEFFIEKQVTTNNTDINTQLLIGANDVTAFFGSGYNSDPNDPEKDAVGVKISDGSLGLVINQLNDETAKYALSASGNANLIGVEDVTLSGNLELKVNQTGGAVAQNITLPSGSEVAILFTQNEGNITRLQGNAELDILGSAVVSGEFFFEKQVINTLTELRIGANDVTAFVGSNYGTANEMGVEISEGQLGLVINGKL
jgi:hypothetical protein